ncbi:MAG: iron-sulfur cluster assembly scaffold protein [Planctomycetota bacterium]
MGGLPPNKMHCSNLAAQGLHKAIQDYLAKTGVSIELPEGEEEEHAH